MPGNLRVTGQTHNTVTLAWDASTGGAVSYDVLRAGTVVGTPTGTTFTVTVLTPSTTYQFTVRARDAAGNASAQTGPVSATTSPAPPASNLLLNKPATADSSCAAAEGPAKAVNGSRQRRPHRQVVLARHEQVAAGRHRVERLRRPDRGAAFGGRRRVRPLEHPRLRRADQHERHDVDDGRGGARQHRGRHDAHVHGGGARYARLNVLVPTQDGDPAARIYELEAYAS